MPIPNPLKYVSVPINCPKPELYRVMAAPAPDSPVEDVGSLTRLTSGEWDAVILGITKTCPSERDARCWQRETWLARATSAPAH